MKKYLGNTTTEILKNYFYDAKNFKIKKLNDNALLIAHKSNNFVLKKYPLEINNKKLNRTRINFLGKIQTFVSKNLSIKPKLIFTLKNETSVAYDHHLYQLIEYVSNYPPNPRLIKNKELFYNYIGSFLGKLHASLKEYSKLHSQENSPESILKFNRKGIRELYDLLKKYEKNNIGNEWKLLLIKKIEIAKQFCNQVEDFRVLPKQIVHGDFWIQNILFDKNQKIIGLIDYAQGGIFYKSYELIRSALSLDRFFKLKKINPRYLRAYIKGYSKYSKIKRKELQLAIDMYIFIQATNSFCVDIDTLKNKDKKLIDYGKYRFNKLVELYAARNYLKREVL